MLKYFGALFLRNLKINFICTSYFLTFNLSVYKFVINKDAIQCQNAPLDDNYLHTLKYFSYCVRNIAVFENYTIPD